MSQRQRKPDLTGRYRLDVTQDPNGDCHIDETDLNDESQTRVATFPAQKRVVTVKAEDGKESLAHRDMAQVRAVVFAKVFSELASSGQI